MSQNVTQNVDGQLVAILTNLDGTPATGLSFASVSCVFKKETDISFLSKTLTSLNFTEIGSGVYNILFTGASELTVLGSFVFVVTGASITEFVGLVNVVASAADTIATSLPTCVVTGHIGDLTGAPIAGASISVRVTGLPTLISNVGLTDKLITAVTDNNGVFSIELIRLASVDVFIPMLNYRRSITVPNVATADLFSGIA